MPTHPVLVAARVLRENAPKLSHDERRACMTTADHLEADFRRSCEVSKVQPGQTDGDFTVLVEMDVSERREVAQSAHIREPYTGPIDVNGTP